MARKKPCALQNILIRIRPVRDKEAGGFEVRITQCGKTVKYIYRFPMERAQVIKLVLNQIGTKDAHSNSGRRRRNKRNTKDVCV